MLISVLIATAGGVGGGGCYVWYWPGLGHVFPPSNGLTGTLTDYRE